MIPLIHDTISLFIYSHALIQYSDQIVRCLSYKFPLMRLSFIISNDVLNSLL